MVEMVCEEFEGLVGDYLAKDLGREQTGRFGAHAMKCRNCRFLLDDVKKKLQESELGQPGASIDLELSLEKIPGEHGGIDCSRFEDLVTEFLDGFVPASTYHRFVEHSSHCDACSEVLTGVVYAVAACHSVHTYEEIEVPGDLAARLLGILPAAPSSARRHGFMAAIGSALSGSRPVRRLGELAGSLAIPAWPRVATASLLSLATLGALSGFSTDLTPGGLYRRAHLRAASVYNESVGIYAQKDEVEARLQQVGSDINLVWQTIGGREDGNGKSNQNRQSGTSGSEKAKTEAARK